MSEHTLNGVAAGTHAAPASPDAPVVAAREGHDDTIAALQQQLSVTRSYTDKHVLLTGSTGFLAKVVAAMLLRYHPDMAQLYLLIRGRRDATAQERFQSELVECGAFEPLQAIYGPGLQEFLAEKVTVLSGDITLPYLGLALEEATALSAKIDLFINSAGLTNFNPNLESALTINTLSERLILEFLGLGDYHAALLHVSTCFVAGNARRVAEEVLPHPRLYPNSDQLETEFDVEREIADCERMIAHAKQQAEDQEQSSVFDQQAREHLRKHNLSPHDRAAYDRAYRHARSEWIKKDLSQQGRKRAAHWGWPNIYTYSKSMGERLLTAHRDKVNFAIVRPAIIESGISFPVKGWNEGINTSAPLAYLRYKGHRYYPTHDQLRLDIIPVDMVSGAMLAIGAALMAKRAAPVYQLGSSDKNPLRMWRILELTSLGARQIRAGELHTPRWKKLVLDSLEGYPVSKETFDRRSAPGVNRALKGVDSLLSKLPTRSLGGLGTAINAARKAAQGAEKATGTMAKMFEIFMPFIYHNDFTFRARAIDALAAMLPEEERDLYGGDIAALDWRDYWTRIHMPGLARHVFPNLEAKLTASNKESYTYQDLIELFDASTNNYANRVALQHHDGVLTERYTYAELRAYAERAASMLEGLGMGPGVCALIVSENRPQWGMAYFGILKARGVAVPVDPQSSAEKILNLTRSAKARMIIVSAEVQARLGQELEALLTELGRPVRVVNFAQLFALQLGFEPAAEPELPPAPDAEGVDPWAALEHDQLASLIFTSGTTGTPKGVMLTHQNFTHLLHSMQQVFRISERDGFLSVLPLHHTFEFTCGFLMPLSRGATVTYIEELNSEELNGAMRATPITALIGVPALWQLLNRRIDQRVQDAPPAARWLLSQLLRLNRATRQRFGVNIGPTVFAAIHRAFGGRIRYLISGGAALPGDLLKSYYGMGFDLYEGYGLTEAAPVLTVNRPDRGLLPGSVGKPLPGVQIEIKDPNAEGVGEVIARGGNIMLGYLNRDEDTRSALRDGWLHTGDLGKLDRKGNLTIVGRGKEVIVTSGGKNVYPDELEDLYGKHSAIEELSVVGLDDGRGSERVAALVRPALPEGATSQDVIEARTVIREWFRVEGSRVGSHERVQVLRFWDDPLPRTPTRKIKRKEVVEILNRLLAAEQKAQPEGDETSAEWAWLDRLIAGLADVNLELVHAGTHLQDDLGFDSLMYVELGSILEARGYKISAEQLSLLDTIAALRDTLGGVAQANAMVHVPQGTLQRVEEYDVPDSLATLGKRLLHRAQMGSYQNFFKVKVEGRHHLPLHDRNVLVASNHSSHLDMGLVKYALGSYGANIRALAAADYFYKDKTRKTYFRNFTNLIPIERSGSLESSLRHAQQAVKAGDMLLIFPEGTRSRDGKIQPFRRGIGYLAASQQVNIVPVYIEGTHRAFPKGAKLPDPTARNLRVIIGKPLQIHELLRETEGMSPMDRYQLIAERAQRAVEALRDGEIEGKRKKPKGVALEPIFDSLNAKFSRDQLDARVSYYFSLGNQDDGKWTVVVDRDSCKVQAGKPADGQADCVIKTTPELFRRMIEERYTPSIDEFMSGVIKTNAPDLLMRFQAVFGL